MEKIMKGIMYDKRIELEEETDIPSGTIVTVKLELQGFSLEERRRRVRKTGGAWRSDVTLGDIFDRIIEERLTSPGREVNLGDSA